MIRLNLKTVEPLHVAAGFINPGQSTDALDEIPGTSLRGALAHEYLKQGNPNDANFQNWFLDEAVRYLPARYEGGQVVPSTAYTCKFQPGFKADGGHGVQDRLLDFLHWPQKLPADRCSFIYPGERVCGARVVRFLEAYKEGDSPASRQPSKRLDTHTALDARMETAAASMLFGLEVVEEGQQYISEIKLKNQEDQKELVKFINELGYLRIGAARSRGYGLMEVNVQPIQDEADVNIAAVLIQNNLNTFHNLWKEEMGSLPEKTIFVLTLKTDCILFDAFLRHRAEITPADLAHFVHPDLINAEKICSFGRTKLLDGWNAAWKLPRPTESVIAAGSVFVFQIDKTTEETARLLAPLVIHGIGERRQEGFGQAAVNHPFHLKKGAR